MNKFAISIAAAVLIIDLVSKKIVQSVEVLHNYEVVEGFFRLHYATNRGMAFSLFDTDSEWLQIFLLVFALFAVAIVIYYIRVTPHSLKIQFLAFGLLLGGILGNTVDRVLNGSVVDFLEVHWRYQYFWPIFNLADSAISSGVILILLTNLFDFKKSRADEPRVETTDAAD